MITPPQRWLRRFWDANSCTWDDQLADPDVVAHIDEVVARFSSLVPPGSTIADLGCGTGTFALRLAALGHPIVGIDFAVGMLRRAGDKQAAAGVDELVYACADLNRLPLRPGSVGAALSMHAVQVLDPDRFLGQVRQIIVPGGPLLIELSKPGGRAWHPPGEPWSHRPFRYFKHLVSTVGFRVGAGTHHTEADLRAALARHGFEVTDRDENELVYTLICRAPEVPSPVG